MPDNTDSSIETIMNGRHSKTSVDEIRIVIVGRVGCGKSMLGNSLLNKTLFYSRISPKRVTVHSREGRSFRDGHTIKVVDTPGFFDTSFSEAETMKELKKCCTLASPGPHVVLFVMRIGHYMEVETLKAYLEHFGHGVMDHTIIVFSGLDTLEDERVSLDQYLKRAPAFLKDVLSKYKYTAVDSTSSSNGSISDLQEMIYSLILENQGKYYKKENIEYSRTAHTQNLEDVLNKRMDGVVNILNSWKQEYENEQQTITVIETLLEHPVGRRTRSSNWSVEVENLLNDNPDQQLLERLPLQLRVQLAAKFNKENISVKRKPRGVQPRESSPASFVVKRSRHTNIL